MVENRCCGGSLCYQLSGKLKMEVGGRVGGTIGKKGGESDAVGVGNSTGDSNTGYSLPSGICLVSEHRRHRPSGSKGKGYRGKEGSGSGKDNKVKATPRI